MAQRRMVSEAQLDHIFSMVNAYANLAGYITRVDELEGAIEAKYREAVETDPRFEHFSPLFGPFVPYGELIASTGAWIGQHIFQSRAYCVGNKVYFLRDDAFRSPLVEQIEELGLKASSKIPFRHFIELAKQCGFSKRVDGLFFDQTRNEISVIKTTTLGRIRRLRPDVSECQLNLFSEGDWLSVACLPAKPVAALTLAQAILATAFPQARVRTFLLIVDMEQWRFDLRETTDTPYAKLRAGSMPLDSLQVVRTTLQTRNSAFAVDEYRCLPRLPVADRIDALPVNRATRSAMILRCLWEQQSSKNGLTIISVPEIFKTVTEKHLIIYPEDLLRHDIEDCLVPNEFVERPRYDKKGFALTPAGVMAALLLREQLREGMRSNWTVDIEDSVLAPIRRQGRFWANYKLGINQH